MDEQLASETDLLLRKCSLLYMRAARKYGLQDLQSEGIIPPQIVAFLKTLDGVALASDAFFPFRDSIDVASTRGVSYVVRPSTRRRAPALRAARA